MWSKWRDHEQGPMPVHSGTTVLLKMENGDILGPMLACDCCWNFPGDAIVAYKVKKMDAMAGLKKIAELENA